MGTYSIVDWHEHAKRRPKPTALPPRHVQFWLHRQEVLEKYVSVHAAGTMLATASIEEAIFNDQYPDWVAARVTVPWAALLSVAGGREELDVSCYLEPSGLLVGNCLLPLPAALRPTNIDRVRAYTSYAHCGISYVFVDGGEVTVGGWALARDRHIVPKVKLAGEIAQVQRARNTRAGTMYWFLQDADWFGFHATAQVPALPEWLDVEVATGGAEDSERHIMWHRLGRRGDLGPLPPDENVRRVSGGAASQNSYVHSGYTEFRTLSTLFAKHGVSLSDTAVRVLDWGCGCGRVSRHVLALPQGKDRLFGIDIDSDNVDWCKSNLQAENFAVVPLLPPTGLHAESFDAAFAVSVLSHLREADAEAWLAEIARVMRPGGLAILTYNGMQAAALNLATLPDALTDLETNGFLDHRRSTSLDGFISDREYYRYVLFTEEHAREMFARHFEVVAIEPSCLAGGQNAAVLRKRGVASAFSASDVVAPAL